MAYRQTKRSREQIARMVAGKAAASASTPAMTTSATRVTAATSPQAARTRPGSGAFRSASMLASPSAATGAA